MKRVQFIIVQLNCGDMLKVTGNPCGERAGRVLVNSKIRTTIEAVCLVIPLS